MPKMSDYYPDYPYEDFEDDDPGPIFMSKPNDPRFPWTKPHSYFVDPAVEVREMWSLGRALSKDEMTQVRESFTDYYGITLA